MVDSHLQPWHDLPNAVHIDRILENARARPEIWHFIWHEDLAAVRAASAAWMVAEAASRAEAVAAAWGAAWDAAGAENTARAAITALIAWDHSAHLLSTDPEQVRLLALLGHQPAVLLYPACLILHDHKEVVC